MKNTLIIAVFALIGNYGLAQVAGQVSSNMASGGSQNTAGSAAIASLLGPINEAYQKRKELELDDFQGSPYTSNEFAPTTLFYKDEKMGKIYYRYNALNEEIEIKRSNLKEENYQALVKDKDISITVDGKPLAFKTFITEKNRTTNGYLTTILDGESYDLFKRTHVKFTEGQPAQNSFVPEVPSRFSHFTEYYFQKEGVNQINEVPTKNRRFLKLLEDGKKEHIKKYLKENDLNVKEKADLVKVIQYLNQ